MLGRGDAGACEDLGEPLVTPEQVPLGCLTVIPDDVLERFAALPADTQVHIPGPCRPRIARIAAENLDGMARGCPHSARLEWIWPRVLLAPLPRHCRASTEVGARLQMWEEQRWRELAARLEVQRLERRGARTAGDGGFDRYARIKTLVRAGAYSKAATALTLEVADLSQEDSLRWAEQLLPRSTGAGAIAVPPRTGDEEDDDAETSAQRLDKAVESLRKLRFGPRTAPGPTGLRPEHLRELAGAQRHGAGRRFIRAMARMAIAATEGRLAAEARWILDSKLVWLKKKGKAAPRPIRIGETYRRAIGKWNVDRAKQGIVRALVADGQLGVGVPCAVEGLVHSYRLLEGALKSGEHGEWLALDIDMVNYFSLLEWAPIREGVAAVAGGLSIWTQWCMSAPCWVHLPDGSKRQLDQGAEQGDPEGSFRACAVLSQCTRAADDVLKVTLREAGIEGEASAFCFFIDDGRVLLRKEWSEIWLRAFDDALRARGGTRVAGDGTCKSTARLLGGADTSDVAWASDLPLLTADV